MRNILKSLSCFVLIITFLFSSGGQISGQRKVSLSAGLGIPELINVGIQYRFELTQIGIGFGYFPPSSRYGYDPESFSWGTLTTISGDIYCHFRKLPKSSDPSSVYAKLGFVYFKEERGVKDNCTIFLSPRIGLENVSKRVGIGIDLGFGIVLSDPMESGPWFFGLPCGGIRVFYRI